MKRLIQLWKSNNLFAHDVLDKINASYFAQKQESSFNAPSAATSFKPTPADKAASFNPPLASMATTYTPVVPLPKTMNSNASFNPLGVGSLLSSVIQGNAAPVMTSPVSTMDQFKFLSNVPERQVRDPNQFDYGDEDEDDIPVKTPTRLFF